MIYTLERVLAKCYSSNVQTEIVEPNGARWWAYAIPLLLWEGRGRIRAAWAVFRGEAIALRYPRAGELELGLAKAGLQPVARQREDTTP